MADWVRLSDTKRIEWFPWRVSTLYKMRYEGRLPEIFSEVEGLVFVDLDEVRRLLDEGRGR